MAKLWNESADWQSTLDITGYSLVELELVSHFDRGDQSLIICHRSNFVITIITSIHRRITKTHLTSTQGKA